MIHPERDAYLAALRTLDDREYADHLAVTVAWAEMLVFVDDPTPAPASVQAAATAELTRLKYRSHEP